MTLSPAGSRFFHVALLAASLLAGNTLRVAYGQEPAAVVDAGPALPSGLAPVSQLTVGGARLAIDSNGTLFRQDNPGKRWHAVQPQWEGKAVELLGIPALTDAPGSGQAPRPEGQQAAYAAVLLRSTAALHWVSLDRGKTWKPSTLDDVRRNDVKWSGE